MFYSIIDVYETLQERVWLFCPKFQFATLRASSLASWRGTAALQALLIASRFSLLAVYDTL